MMQQPRVLAQDDRTAEHDRESMWHSLMSSDKMRGEHASENRARLQ